MAIISSFSLVSEQDELFDQVSQASLQQMQVYQQELVHPS
jgi:hypothetical protein